MHFYHYCPHYILLDEKDNKYDPEKFTMHSVEITGEKITTWGIMTCIVSLSQNHKLHPKNHQDEFEVEFNDLIWTISDPIKKCVFYDEGLINAFDEDKQELETI